MPVEEARAGLWRLEHKAARRPNGKYLNRMERRMAKEIHGLLMKQLEYVLRHAAALTVFKKGIRRVARKELDTELADLTRNLPHAKALAQNMARYGALVMLKGARSRIQKLKLGQFGISFDLSNRHAVDWLSGITNLHLSTQNGSITRTTQDGIIKVITQGAQEGLTYGEMSKRIQALGDAGLFSPARAELIATRTIAEGYEFGNRQPVNEAKERGLRVQKLWQTVEDEKVTPECEANQEEGWLELDEGHASGEQNPPRLGNPRCRCSEAYRVLD